MRKRFLIAGALVLLTGLIVYAVIAATSSSIRLKFDFCHGAQGWEAGFAEYSPEMEDMMQLEAGIRPLPSELGTECTGYYLQGMNLPDDLFMFLKRRLGPDDGVVPNQKYRLKYTLVFASNEPTGAIGIGGSPGESVYLKAGACPIEPEVYLDPELNYYRMNVDKAEGNTGSGEAASMVGHIANGLRADKITDWENRPYVSVKRNHVHTYTATASPDGELWLLVGTDSGFEGLTGIYYQHIEVTLKPVK
ncbi:MAG TPA: hypothetical protein ENN57_01135 [Chloroflexi bacterium]|nr:hypothetical protein [Chloroflexota bacterium]